MAMAAAFFPGYKCLLCEVFDTAELLELEQFAMMSMPAIFDGYVERAVRVIFIFGIQLFPGIFDCVSFYILKSVRLLAE